MSKMDTCRGKTNAIRPPVIPFEGAFINLIPLLSTYDKPHSDANVLSCKITNHTQIYTNSSSAQQLPNFENVLEQ